jgi:hypothetical protein
MGWQRNHAAHDERADPEAQGRAWCLRGCCSYHLLVRPDKHRFGAHLRRHHCGGGVLVRFDFVDSVRSDVMAAIKVCMSNVDGKAKDAKVLRTKLDTKPKNAPQADTQRRAAKDIYEKVRSLCEECCTEYELVYRVHSNTVLEALNTLKRPLEKKINEFFDVVDELEYVYNEYLQLLEQQQDRRARQETEAQGTPVEGTQMWLQHQVQNGATITLSNAQAHQEYQSSFDRGTQYSREYDVIEREEDEPRYVIHIHWRSNGTHYLVGFAKIKPITQRYARGVGNTIMIEVLRDLIDPEPGEVLQSANRT